MSDNNNSNKKQKTAVATATSGTTTTASTAGGMYYRPSRAETVQFDPTVLGLPSDFRLTAYSELKG
jgi:hypothetical protein